MSRLSPERWQEISPYLDHALSIAEDERAAWLELFRAEKPDLADLLQKLLDEHRRVAQEHFLERGPDLPTNQPSLAGKTIGAYRLMSLIGQGGMGSVWLGERSDGRFERQVAVKFLNVAVSGQGGTERFKREGSILGRLAHPHIAELIDAGVSASGQPYLVLEYVAGEHIDQYCDQRMLDVDARIKLFLDVLSAVALAHANLTVHRDIKPSNVLVRSDGQVKLLDFGIAKLFSDEDTPSPATLLTLEGGGSLTPQFAAPEQVTGGTVTTATDVYGLGVLLYILLTGQHPAGLALHSPADLVKAIVETEPARASDSVADADAKSVAVGRGTTPEKLRRQLRGDLDTIIGKALKKNPSERYRSVTALAEDLQRYLKQEPISARPDSFLYRARKFVRRNRTAAALTAVAFCAVAAGTAGILMQTRTARKQRDFAFRQASRANAVTDLQDFILVDAAPGGQSFTLDELLGRAEHIVMREHDKDNTNRVELLISIGRHYWGEDEDAKSRRVLDQAYKLSRGLSDPSVRAKAACALASAVARNGESDRGEDLIRDGLREIQNEPQYDLDRAFCLLRGQEVADHSGAAQLGIDRVLEAKDALNRSRFNSDILKLSTEMALAEAYREAGRFRDAIPSFQQAFALLTELGRDDTATAATLLNNWALALEFSGNPLQAEQRFSHAIQLSHDNHGERAVSPTFLVNNAHVLNELARTKEAEDYAQRGYRAATELGDQETINQALLDLARIYRQAGQLARSTALLDEVEPRLRQNLPAGHYAFAALASERALDAQAAGDLHAASRYEKDAMDILNAAVRTGKEGAHYMPILLGRQSGLDLQLGRPDQAAADASAQLSLAQKDMEPGQYSANMGHAFLNLGMALQAQGKTNEARAAFRSAADHLERTLGPDHPDSRAARQSAGLTSQ